MRKGSEFLREEKNAVIDYIIEDGKVKKSIIRMGIQDRVDSNNLMKVLLKDDITRRKLGWKESKRKMGRTRGKIEKK